MKHLLEEAWKDEPRKDGPSIVELLCLGFRRGPPHMKKHMICQAVTTFIFFMVYLYFNGGLIPWFLTENGSSKIKSDDTKLSVDVLQYFPEAEHDGTKVTWAHGTDSKNALQQAMAGPAMIIEGDIGLKGMDSTADRKMVAIMIQPPSFESDLTFDEWIDIVKGSKKAIKLDFMHIEAVELALQKLQAVQTEMNVPIHISAAVMNGPNHNSARRLVLDPSRFMRLVRANAPKATMVLGWADASPKDEESVRYDWSMVLSMQDLVDHWRLRQPVSYNVRASLVRKSLSQLRWLMEMTAQSSLTVTAPTNDKVNIQDLLFVRTCLPKNRVLYDLHVEIQSQVESMKDMAANFQQFKQGANVHNMEQRLVASDAQEGDNTFHGKSWNVAEGERNQKVYLGTEAVVMQKGLLVSRRPIEATARQMIIVYGRVEFFNVDKKVENAGIEIFLHAAKRVRHISVKGPYCKIGINGEMTIKDETNEKVEIINGKTPCFMFRIKYQPGVNVNVAVARPSSCANMPDSFDSIGVEGLSQLDLPMSKQYDEWHIAVRHDDENSFVAIDQLRITS